MTNRAGRRRRHKRHKARPRIYAELGRLAGVLPAQAAAELRWAVELAAAKWTHRYVFEGISQAEASRGLQRDVALAIMHAVAAGALWQLVGEEPPAPGTIARAAGIGSTGEIVAPGGAGAFLAAAVERSETFHGNVSPAVPVKRSEERRGRETPLTPLPSEEGGLAAAEQNQNQQQSLAEGGAPW